MRSNPKCSKQNRNFSGFLEGHRDDIKIFQQTRKKKKKKKKFF